MTYIQVANIRGNIILEDYIQIPSIIGNKYLNKKNMYTNTFYTLCMKNPNGNIGLRKKGMFVFENKNIEIDYLCSDFVRFCLSIYKNNQNIDQSILSIIPKQSIPISEELKKYIEEFLPDFYDTRTN